MNTKNGDILVLAEWAASYEAIGKKNNFTPEEIAEHGKMIQMAMRNLIRRGIVAEEEIACRVDWAQRLTGEAKP